MDMSVAPISSMPTTDTELIAQYATTRDAECFAQLVTRHRDMVYSAAARVVRDTADAEDVTQECFLRLARDAARIRSSVGGWLHRTAINSALNTVRSARIRRERETEAAAADVSHLELAAWGDIRDENAKDFERIVESETKTTAVTTVDTDASAAEQAGPEEGSAAPQARAAERAPGP